MKHDTLISKKVSEDFWLRKLSNQRECSGLFSAADSIPAQDEHERISVTIPREITNKMKTLFRGVNSDANKFLVYLSILKILYFKYTGCSDVLVGTTDIQLPGLSHSRDRLIFLSSSLSSHLSFKETMVQEQYHLLEAFKYHNYDYKKFLARYRVMNADNSNEDNLFYLGLYYNRFNAAEVPGNTFDILLSIHEVMEPAPVTHLRITYGPGKDKRIIHYFLQNYLYTLENLLKNSGTRLNDPDFICPFEKELLEKFSRPPVTFPVRETVIDLFKKQVQETPDAAAVVFQDKYVTYKQLDRWSDRAARHLAEEYGIQPGEVVGLMVPRSDHLVMATLGILKAGAIFLAIDHNYPVERKTVILKDSICKLLVTETYCIEEVRTYWAGNLMDIDTLHHRVVSGGTLSCSPYKRLVSTNDGAFLIYTSGSTGTPKGILQTHRCLVNVVQQQVNHGGFDRKMRILQFSSIGFDVYIAHESFFSLLSGGCLYITSEEHRTDFKELGQFILATGINWLLLPVTILNTLIVLSHELWSPAIALKHMVSAGEQLNLSSKLTQYLKTFPQIKLHNFYGPSETHTGTTHMLDPIKANGNFQVHQPIGKPSINTWVYILSPDLQIVPLGTAGEIYMAGAGLAKGYLNQPGLTRERFIANPFCPGELMYKTGDIAWWLPDGNLHFVGRRDNQVKIRGIRVEPGEIENKLLEHPKVSKAAVVARKETGGSYSLYAYIIPSPMHAPVLSGQNRYLLPNNMAVFQKNVNETDFLYTEIFEESTYLPGCITYNDGDTVIDIGANIGMFSLFVSQVCKNPKIYAFEPIPILAKLCRMNLNLYAPGAIVFDCGISGKKKTAEFTYYPRATVWSGFYGDEQEDEQTMRESLKNEKNQAFIQQHMEDIMDGRFAKEIIQCQLIPLSAVIKENRLGQVDLLKIDAEKSEWDVLCGIEPDDWKRIKQIIVEVHDIDHRKDRVKNLLESKGFRLTIEQSFALKKTDLYHFYAVRPPNQDCQDKSPEENFAGKKWQPPILENPLLTTSQLREYAVKRLPDSMVPSIFVLLESFPLNPNGKVDIKALPDPKSVGKGFNYIPPATKLEKELVELWAELLEIDKDEIGINDNFFELGGHSLKATILTAEIQKKFDVKATLAEMFNTPTIKGLAAFIEKSAKNEYQPIEPAQKKEYYVLSSAQKRLYILQQMNPRSTAYNLMLVVRLEGQLRVPVLENSFRLLIQRHEILRTSFQLIAKEPVQEVYDAVEFEMDYVDLAAQDPGGKLNRELLIQREQQAVARIGDFIRPFDLAQVPLLRVGLIRIQETCYLLMFDMHHIITDGVSQGIMAKKLLALYQEEKLPPVRIQYKDYSEWQKVRCSKEALKKQEAYWLKMFAGDIPVLDLPVDYTRPTSKHFEGNSLVFSLNNNEVSALKELEKAGEVTLYMVLLAAFYVFLTKLSNQEDIVVGTGLAGREHPDLRDMLGMFVNTLALRHYPQAQKTIREFIGEIKKQTLEIYENQDYPFETLVGRVASDRDNSRNPLFDVLFTLQNVDVPHIAVPGLELSPWEYENRISLFDLVLIAVEKEEKLFFTFVYSTKLFKEETGRRLVHYLKKVITGFPGNIGNRISQIELAGEEEKKQLLIDFNRPGWTSAYPGSTGVGYSSHKTIQGLFARQVEKNPDRTAIIGWPYGRSGIGMGFTASVPGEQELQVTYGQLNEKSNQLAHLLRQKGVGPDTIVGLMAERSLEMIAAMMGILKAGGAYLPIDRENPLQRILAMLEDCQAPVLLTETGILAEHSFSELQGFHLSSPGVTLVTRERPQITNLDALPFAHRWAVDYEKYNKYIGQGMVKNSISLQATRGCPYNCAYCHKIWPRRHIYRSAENIFQEVQLYYNMGVRRFVFVDDIFNMNIPNSERFFRLIIREGLKVQLFFPNGMRGDILTREYIDLMVKAGVVSLALALETASPRLQKLIGKNLDIERLRENLRYFCEKYPQVILELFTMHGFPTETQEEAHMTLDFIKSLKWLHFPYISILRIFPNTDMEKIAIENGISPEAIASSQGLAFHELPETLVFDKNFTLKYQADFLNRYFLSKERLLKVLPHQMLILTEDEMVQKYNSYLPTEIRSLDDLLQFVGINRDELDADGCLEEDWTWVPGLNGKIKAVFPPDNPDPDALRVLLLDVSQNFSGSSHMLYDVVEPPLGLMHLLAYLKHTFGPRVNGKIAKSRIDFDNYLELCAIIKEFKPHIIGIRTLTFYRDHFHKIAAMIRHWGFDGPVIAGGPYATSARDTILQDRNINLVVIGEGELTMAEVVKEIMDNNRALPGVSRLKKIKGIAFRSGTGEKIAPGCSCREIIMMDHLEKCLEVESTGNPPYSGQPGDLAYVIYTSGSTGIPKGALTTHANVNRVAYQPNYVDIGGADRILQLSNFAFDGSVFDIYGSLLNGAALVLIKKQDILAADRLAARISCQAITVFFITTALLNTLVELELQSLQDVRKVLFGGERISAAHSRKALRYLGQGRLIHVYGPTETTVYATWYEINHIDDRVSTIPIGSPISGTSLYVLDTRLNLVPIGVGGELYIGGDGLARGYLNQPALTAEIFCLQKNFPPRHLPQYPINPLPHSPIYRTGDLVRWLPGGEVEFMGRLDQQVKIRGFRIELGEIEARLLKHETIKETVVTVREETPGNKCLCAYIAARGPWETSELKDFLARKLPMHMIPSFFVPISNIPLSANGKVNVKALPSPLAEAGNQNALPGDEIQEKLAWMWSQVLGIEKSSIRIDANFFELGGHSLKVTLLTALIHQELHIKIPLTEIFRKPTIGELSGYIKGGKRKAYTRLENTEEKEYYRLSSAQKRLFILQQLDTDSTAYNVPNAMMLVGELDVKKLTDTFRSLIRRHEGLRTSFLVVDNEPVQRIHDYDEVIFDAEYYDLATSGGKDYNEKKDREVESVVRDFIRPFDLEKAPLMRVGVIKPEKAKHILMIDFHHIIIDGSSRQVVTRDFMALYQGEKLAPLTLRYRDYSEARFKLECLNEWRMQEKYWLRQMGGHIPELKLPTDYPRPRVQGFKGQRIFFNMDREITGALKHVLQQEDVTLFMLLLALLNVLLSRLSAEEDIVMGTTAASRKNPELRQVVGLFVGTLALRNRPSGEMTCKEFLKEVKKTTLEAFDNQDYPFEKLVEKLGINWDARRNPLFNVVLMVQNLDPMVLEIPGLKLSPYPFENTVSKFDLTLYAEEVGEGLSFELEYNTSLFKENTILQIVDYFKKLVADAPKELDRKIADIEIVPRQEMEQLISELYGELQS